MDINSFYTAQINSQAGIKDSTITAKSTAPTGGLNFLEFLMATLDANKAAKTAADTSASKDQPLDSDNATLDPDVDLADLLALTPEIRQEIQNLHLDPNLKLSQTMMLNQKALEAAIKSSGNNIVVDGKIQPGQPPKIIAALLVEAKADAQADNALLAKLQSILSKLESLTNGQQSSLLIASNLTAEQITDLKTKVEALINENAGETISEEDRKKAIDGIYLGLINLIAPPPQNNAAALGIAANLAKSQNEDTITSAPGSLTSHAAAAPAKTSDVSPGAMDDGSGNGVPTDGTNKFGNMLKDFSKDIGKKNIANDLGSKTPGVKADLSVLQGWPFNISGSIFSPTIIPYDAINAQAPILSPVAGVGSLTNLVTQAHSVTQPHPAIALVAATIAKSAAAGETKNITLKLDPPELGRVEVRMSFGKDKSIKAVILAEKPETLALMQRDSHALERSLMDSGLDSNGNLSFQLAQDGHDFSGRGGNGGQNSSGGEAPEQIIESTMTWQVDPETGHMHYNILA